MDKFGKVFVLFLVVGIAGLATEVSTAVASHYAKKPFPANCQPSGIRPTLLDLHYDAVSRLQ